MYTVTTFYKFYNISEARVAELKVNLSQFAKENKIKGLIISGCEGINGTVAALELSILKFKEFLLNQSEFKDLEFKDSLSVLNPFKRFKIRAREEIVTLRNPEILPNENRNYLNPVEWNNFIKSNQDVSILDVRNTYETEIGMFKGAIDPKLTMFNEFEDFVKKTSIPKDKPVLMYCTGGIRCEKASLVMQEQGFKDVYQLQGGVLKYLEEFPKGGFEGECFVFDSRVAVDSNLKPTERYKLCPHCGNPGDFNIECKQCSKAAIICKHCANEELNLTCSKNCKHHFGARACRSTSLPERSLPGCIVDAG